MFTLVLPGLVERYILWWWHMPLLLKLLTQHVFFLYDSFGHVNYEDPHYAVSLPVFSIHGNHDDPSRDGGGAEVGT